MYSSFIFRRLHTTKGRLEDKITTQRRRIIDHTHIVQCVIFKVTAIPRLTLTHWFLLMDMQLLWEHSQHLIMLYWCSLFSAAVQQTNAWFFFPPLLRLLHSSSSFLSFFTPCPLRGWYLRLGCWAFLAVYHSCSCLIWWIPDVRFNPVVKAEGVIKRIYRNEWKEDDPRGMKCHVRRPNGEENIFSKKLLSKKFNTL